MRSVNEQTTPPAPSSLFTPPELAPHTGRVPQPFRSLTPGLPTALSLAAPAGLSASPRSASRPRTAVSSSRTDSRAVRKGRAAGRLAFHLRYLEHLTQNQLSDPSSPGHGSTLSPRRPASSHEGHAGDDRQLHPLVILRAPRGAVSRPGGASHRLGVNHRDGRRPSGGPAGNLKCVGDLPSQAHSCTGS